jgi:S1-C subfamily serine protease
VRTVTLTRVSPVPARDRRSDRHPPATRQVARVVAAGLALLVAMAVLAACSSAAQTASQPQGSSASARPAGNGRRADGQGAAEARALRTKLGVGGRTLTPDVAQALGISATDGVYVIQVGADGPASKAALKGAFAGSGQQGRPAPQGTPGLRRQQTPSAGEDPGQQRAAPVLPKGGDVITAVDGQKVASVEDLSTYLDTKQSGDPVHLSVLRDGQSQTVDVVLGA